MTREEFETAYAERAGHTVEWLHKHGRRGYPCDCDYELCEGWQMLSRDTLEDAITLGRIEPRWRDEP